MEIFINGEKLEFILEDEKTAYDIIQALCDFYASDEPQKFITSIFVDGKEYSYADEKSLKNLKIENIQKMELEFNDIIGVSLLSIKQIILYLQYIEELILKNTYDENFAKILDSLNWMKQGITQIVNIFGTSKGDLSSLKNRFITRFNNFEALIKEMNKREFPLDKDFQMDVINGLKSVEQVLNTFFNSINNATKVPDNADIIEEIDAVVEKLDKIIPQLSEVPIHLQKGYDKNAMDVVENLANVIDKTVSLLVILKDFKKINLSSIKIKNEPFDAFFGRIIENLKELMKSMEYKDTVMVGDLLEYEFVPFTEELKKVLMDIRNNSLISIN